MNQSEIEIALTPVVTALDELGIAYYIGGSIASSIYGIARATLDVDIIADFSESAASQFAERLHQKYYFDLETMLQAINTCSSFNLVHLETMVKIDIFIPKNTYDRSAFERKKKDTLFSDSNAIFFVGSVEDILLNKLLWYKMGGEISERQWNDIIGILKVQQNSMDVAYLKKWSESLDVKSLLDKAFAEYER
ncbi:hypothetical protein K1X84_05110 [bacterium]|nr:hypothetical protein [bacterium]